MKSVILSSAANGSIYLFANIISVFKQLHLEPVLNDSFLLAFYQTIQVNVPEKRTLSGYLRHLI